MTVTHSTTATSADDPGVEINKAEWNASHTVGDGSFVAAKLSATATDKVFGRSTAGAGNGEEITLTAAGRALIDDADAAAQRTTLGIATAITGTKLDDFATPDDNTDLNASTSRHGLLLKLNNNSANFLNGQGAWATPSGGGGTTPTILLDYTQSGDISALSVTSSTWTDIIANQNFTVASASSLIEIVVRGFAFVDGASGQTEASTRVVVDSAGTPINEQIGGNVVESGAQRGNPFAGSGSIFISGLSAAVHTIKPQIYFQGSNSGFYCRPSGSPPEFLRIQVIEHL